MAQVLIRPDVSIDRAWRSASEQEVWSFVGCFWAAGVVQGLLSHPGDVIKVLQQGRSFHCHNVLGYRSPASASATTVLRQLLAAQAARTVVDGRRYGGAGWQQSRAALAALYRGGLVPIVCRPISLLTGFYAHRRAVEALYSSTAGGEYWQSSDVLTSAMCGAWTGLWMALPETFLDLLLVQSQSGHQFGNSWAAYRELGYRGPPYYRGPMQGLTATVCRNVPAHALYFAVLDAVGKACHWYNASGEPGAAAENTSAQIMLAGAAAGSAYWLVAYPLDTLKTRMQFDHSAKHQAVYPSLRAVWRDRAVAGPLYRGVLPTLLRAAPTNALAYLAFETARGCFGVGQR